MLLANLDNCCIIVFSPVRRAFFFFFFHIICANFSCVTRATRRTWFNPLCCTSLGHRCSLPRPSHRRYIFHVPNSAASHPRTHRFEYCVGIAIIIRPFVCRNNTVSFLIVDFILDNTLDRFLIVPLAPRSIRVITFALILTPPRICFSNYDSANKRQIPFVFFFRSVLPDLTNITSTKVRK